MRRRLFIIGCFFYPALIGGPMASARAAEGSGGLKTYKIDPEHSVLRVHTDTAGIFRSFGHPLTIVAKKFSGVIRFKPGDPQSAQIEFQVDPNSLTVETKVSNYDREDIEGNMYDQVLNTADYPEIRYASAAVSGKKLNDSRYQIEIMGNLSLKGETRTLPISTEVVFKDGELRAKGSSQFKQTLFKIKPFTGFGGAIKLKDEIKISFEIRAKP